MMRSFIVFARCFQSENSPFILVESFESGRDDDSGGGGACTFLILVRKERVKGGIPTEIMEGGGGGWGDINPSYIFP